MTGLETDKTFGIQFFDFFGTLVSIDLEQIESLLAFLFHVSFLIAIKTGGLLLFIAIERTFFSIMSRQVTFETLAGHFLRVFLSVPTFKVLLDFGIRQGKLLCH